MSSRQICPGCGKFIEDAELRYFIWDDVKQRNIRLCGDPECTKKMGRIIFQRNKAAKKEKATLIKG